MWIALRDACSPDFLLSDMLSIVIIETLLPSNIIDASFPEPVFIKNCFSVPSLSLVVILDVDAKLDPAAPEIVVSLGSKDKSLATAESIVMLLDLLVVVESFLIIQSINSMRTETTSSC